MPLRWRVWRNARLCETESLAIWASTGSRGAYQALSINPSKNFKGVTHVLTTAYCRPFVGRERPGDGADHRYQPERRLRQAHLRRTDGQARLRPRRGGCLIYTSAAADDMQRV